MMKISNLFFCVLLVMYPFVMASKSELAPSIGTLSVDVKVDTKIISTALMKAIDNLREQSQKIMDMAFTKLGSRSVYIERNLIKDWYSAEESCSRMGGHLITIQNEEEMSAITKHLHIKDNEHYWLGIVSDLSNNGVFLSLVTGHNAPYFKWGPSAPDNLQGLEFCVDLYQSHMWDNNCLNKYYFICEH